MMPKVEGFISRKHLWYEVVFLSKRLLLLDVQLSGKAKEYIFLLVLQVPLIVS